MNLTRGAEVKKGQIIDSEKRKEIVDAITERRRNGERLEQICPEFNMHSTTYYLWQKQINRELGLEKPKRQRLTRVKEEPELVTVHVPEDKKQPIVALYGDAGTVINALGKLIRGE
jgi:transposase-like protein